MSDEERRKITNILKMSYIDCLKKTDKNEKINTSNNI